MMAIADPQFSPHSDIAITVPRVAKAVSKKLIPKRTVARNLSGF